MSRVNAYPTTTPSFPAAVLGYAEVTSSQTFTAAADATGFSVTVTVPAGRRLRVSGYVRMQNNNASANHVWIFLRNVSNADIGVAAVGLTGSGTNGSDETVPFAHIFTPAAGTHTFKLWINAAAFNVTSLASAAEKAHIMVEDITGTTWPAGALTYGQVFVCTSTTRPTSPVDGQFIYETDTDRLLVWNGTNWTQYRLGFEPDRIYNGGIANGTATSYTDIITQNSILSLPYPYRMEVVAYIHSAGNAATNNVNFQLRDESGNSIHFSKTIVDPDWILTNTTSGAYAAITAMGAKDYAAGATCGFRLAYKVNTSNIYWDAAIRVSFVPRV